MTVAREIYWIREISLEASSERRKSTKRTGGIETKKLLNEENRGMRPEDSFSARIAIPKRQSSATLQNFTTACDRFSIWQSLLFAKDFAISFQFDPINRWNSINKSSYAVLAGSDEP
jgi:hypothetical protein